MKQDIVSWSARGFTEEVLLFNFEVAVKEAKATFSNFTIKCGTRPESETWGCSSAGRAPALHAGGQEFDPPHLHQVGKRRTGGPMNLGA